MARYGNSSSGGACNHDWRIKSAKWEQCSRCLRFHLRSSYTAKVIAREKMLDERMKVLDAQRRKAARAAARTV